MVSMELVVVSDISLRVWIIILLWPLNCTAHGFHDGYAFDGLDIEGVFRNLSSVPLV